MQLVLMQCITNIYIITVPENNRVLYLDTLRQNLINGIVKNLNDEDKDPSSSLGAFVINTYLVA